MRDANAASRARAAMRLALALALGALAWAASERLRRSASPTFDEPVHARAARELRSGPGVVSNFEHPLLAKLLAGLPLAREPGDVREDVRRCRLPFPVLYGVFVAAATLWASRRLGPLPGASYGALLALEPSLRGHAALVHTDVPLTVFLGGSVMLLDLAIRARGGRLPAFLAAGAVYGLALGTKHSALPMLPIVAAAAAVPLFRCRRRRSVAAPLAVFAASALLVFLAVQLGASARTDRSAFVSAAERVYSGVAGPGTVRGISERWPVGLASYAIGALQIRATTAPGARYSYFFGRVSGTGWLLYLPVALALKLTTASVVLVVAGLAAALDLAFRPRGAARRFLGRAFLPLAVGVGYLALGCTSRLSIGVRHALPAVPLLLFAAVAALTLRLRASPRALAAVLLTAASAAAVEAAGHAGREISFGNAFAGGSRGLRRFLSDSNTDWGQGQERVFARMARGDLGRCGVVSISFDGERARRERLTPIRLGEEGVPERFDAVFASVTVLDVLHAMETNAEPYPHFVAARRNLSPWIREIAARARTSEEVGDEHVLFRYR